MTILAKMTSLSLNPKHLTVCEDTSRSSFDQLNRSRPRSERASSLALPNNSLLDLYDKEQEQCSSIALLPSNVNVVVRRHSSHCYPMSDDKSPSRTSQPKEELNRKLDLNLKTVSHKLSHPSAEKAIEQQVNKSTPPPPPVPKRTFRGKLSWNTGRSDDNSKQNLPNTKGIRNVQSNHKQNPDQSHAGYGGFCSILKKPVSVSPTPMFGAYQHDHPTNVSQQCIYNGISPNEQISDDDRMSLENSVFDESISIASKALLPGSMANANHQRPSSGSGNSTGSTRSIPGSIKSSGGGPTPPNGFACNASTDLCAVNSSTRRANRSSADSNKSQTTSDTGYMSSNGSERNPSDFRSRFSSVDTQSSLDSCLTEKTIDSPLSKESFKIDSGNDTPPQCGSDTASNFPSTNTVKVNSSPGVAKQVPAVPVRKHSSIPPKIPPPVPQISGNRSASTTSTTRPIPPTPPSRAHHQMNGDLPNRGVGHLLNNSNGPATSTQPHQYSSPTEQDGSIKPLTIRNKLTKHKPPPIVYPKLHQRQDSSLSSDSFSMTSSPGYNSKSLMEAPLIQSSSAKAKKMAAIRHQDSSDSFGMTAAAMRYNNAQGSKTNARQDSSLSSDSFSQTSSPGYNTKLLEAPLLPSMKRFINVPTKNFQNETIEELEQTVPTSPITKSISTPASLQTIVRFQNGTSNMSLQHRIINRRKSSNPYVTNGRLKFRLFQILLNAFALLAIAGGLAAYFNAYPTIKFVNKTIINTIRVEEVSEFGKNPAPGTCLPIIVKFCQGPLIPYNYTVFPNYIGHFGQLETQADLDAYDALVDVRCYELVALFLCSLFVPKCGSTGSTVPPCRTLCTETMRRCGFFFDVFGLSLPDYLNCNLFKDFDNTDECVGLHQVREVMIAARNPVCSGFLCDQTRCIPNDYVCDGHLDCMDETDENKCDRCDADSIYCGEDRCMSSKHICDGVIDCPYGQDERHCIRLSERNGDMGKGVLEVFRHKSHKWMPACVKNWDRSVSPTAVCSMLGYNSVNATSVVTQKTRRTLLTSVNVSTEIWDKPPNLMKEFASCTPEEDYPIAELTCVNYECGKTRREKYKPSRRIIGGSTASPGSWPFLAAILGGPEKIFYCAGVLISDQWVLTASHCIGNHTLIDLDDWTIQLGVTRRDSYTFKSAEIKVKNVIPHPLYNTQIAHDNDIALFQLSSRVSFHEHLLPVCLPPPGLKQLKPGELCTVIGWGKREDKNPKATYEPIVNEVQVPVIRRQQCDEWLDNLTVSDGMICAGFEEGGKDACQGDSGGPLLCPYPGKKGKWFVGGIVSWGIMCAHPKLPGVYANVIKYIPWIVDEIQKYTKPAHRFHEPRGSNRSPSRVTGYGNRSPTDIDYYNNYEKP